MGFALLVLAFTLNARPASFFGPVLSERLILRQAQDERRVEGLRMSAHGEHVEPGALRVPTSRSQQQPVPQPFPRPGSNQPAVPPPAPSTRPAPPPTRSPAGPEGAPTEATLGVPIYPGAQFIASYDAGRGQRYYIFGSAATFVDLVAYYRTVLKQKGELVYEVPATHEFDVGKYREETMAFPPGVTIKDYQSDISQGYPNPKPGAQPARFPTLIQIVPVTER